MNVFIIAEIGSAWRFWGNHLGKAIDAVSVAKWAGANAIKFQFTSNPHKMAQRRAVPECSYDILAWPQEWIASIKQQCDEIGIEFMCTVFLAEDVEILNPYVSRWKVASLENNDGELVRRMMLTGKPVISSHGATEDSPSSACWSDYALHCTAAYPASLDSLNLSVISKHGYEGYSDHSCNILTGAMAVACGAKIVEVHFKLQDTPADNPDYLHSHWPNSLNHYIDNIRLAEVMLGDGVKKIEVCEQWALQHKVKT